MRVAFLMPVLVIISLVVRGQIARQQTGAAPGPKTPLLPWFTVVFVALMLLNSTGWVPAMVQAGASDLSQGFLVLAIAGVGLKTSLKDVTQMGWRPILMLVIATSGLALMSGTYLLLMR